MVIYLDEQYVSEVAAWSVCIDTSPLVLVFVAIIFCTSGNHLRK